MLSPELSTLSHHGISLVEAEANQQQLNILSQASELFSLLHKKFEGERQRILSKRKVIQTWFDTNTMQKPRRLLKHPLKDGWQVAPPPPEILDRRVEITGPPTRKMIINALNSGAKVYMSDFEDSCAPTWSNIIDGQVFLKMALDRSIDFATEKKEYKLNDDVAVLFVRPRGWHLNEKHIQVHGEAASASLFDFALYFANNWKNRANAGKNIYFYLPKLETHEEARVWASVFREAEAWADKQYQHRGGISTGFIRATVLIETITAAFEMDEILYELRHHSAGLNCGRWDYIFSFIKKHRKHKSMVLPDRSEITMTVPFMQEYVDNLIRICHRRGAHAMGGMAAQIPITGDAAANEVAMNKVKADKEREFSAGHDGTWVAHPKLVPIAMEIADNLMPGPNQIHKYGQASQYRPSRPPDGSGANLVRPCRGTVTEQGVETNVTVALDYLSAWISGNGCVPINHLMEDAATAEISRTQLWSWATHKTNIGTVGGQVLDKAMFGEFVKKWRESREVSVQDEQAISLLREMVFCRSKDFPEFLTLKAYNLLD